MQTLKFLAAACMAGGIATGARAGVVSQTGAVADSTTDFTKAFAVTGGVDDTIFAGFNAALGTLTSVSISYSVDGTETGTLTNHGSLSQTFKFFSSSNVSVVDAGMSAPSALTDYLGSGLTLNEPVNTYTLASGASTPIVPSPNGFGTGKLDESTIFTGAAADEFIGKNFALDLTTFSTSTFAGGGGNITTALSTFDGGNISIVYNYAPLNTVPEPSTLAALGAGLLGLTFVRLRKRV